MRLIETAKLCFFLYGNGVKKYLIPLVIILFLTHCKKDQDQVPNVSVDFYVYMSQPDYASLNIIGNYKYLTGGYKGIILYHESSDIFIAYDRACPYDPTTTGAIVDVDSSGLALVDYHCGSKFNILNGAVDNGPASKPLKQYAADYDGYSIVHVH